MQAPTVTGERTGDTLVLAWVDASEPFRLPAAAILP
jgi:hypothetical protein